MLLRILVAASCFLFTVSNASGFSCEEITVAGLKHLPEDGVIAAAGLPLGKPCDEADFQRAAQALVDLGLFDSVRFAYSGSKAGKGIRVDFAVEEYEGERLPAVLSFPDVDEAELWKWLEERDPLVMRVMPTAEAYVRRVGKQIEKYLEEKGAPAQVATSTDADFATQRMQLLFHLADPPVVTGWVFEGASGVSPVELSNIMAKLSDAPALIPARVRAQLDQNVRPYYEERGYLGLRIAGLESASRPSPNPVHVRVTLEEGPVYQLRDVTVEGPGMSSSHLLDVAKFPVGKVANARLIGESLARVARAFREQGHLLAEVEFSRDLEESTKQADLSVSVRPGPQFRFAALELKGVPASHEASFRSQWPLKPGDVMRESAAEDFVHAVREKLPRGVTIAIEKTPRADNSVTVTITFKGFAAV